MTRDEIMRIASESGIEWQRHTGVLGRISVTTCGSQSVERLERFAALVAAAEREQCALTAWEIVQYEVHADLADQVAQAIRARGKA